MSDASSNLSELASFVRPAEAETNAAGHRTGGRLVAAQKPKPRHSVTELLGVVLILSARTRRVMQPRIDIDLDVFAPGGGRAVRMLLPRE